MFYRRLRVKIFTMLLAGSLTVVSLQGISLSSAAQKTIKNSILNAHKEIAVSAAQSVDLFVKGPQDILRTTAAMLSVVYPAPWKQETVLVELALEQPVIMRAAVVDTAGRTLASSELGRNLSWDAPEAAVSAILRQPFYISEVRVQENRIPYVTMSVPLKKSGRIIGVVVADVNLKGMWDIVDGVTVGKTGRAFVVAADGMIIAHNDKKKVIRRENMPLWKAVNNAAAGRSGAISSTDAAGIRWINAYAPLAIAGWRMVLYQKESEAYAPARMLAAYSFLLIAAALAAAAVVSFVLASIFVRPIEKLFLDLKMISAKESGGAGASARRRGDEVVEINRLFTAIIERLKAAKEKEHFVSIGEAAVWITHELKNCLVSIKAFVQLFPQKHADMKFVDAFSKLIPGEIARWERMLKELSDFSSRNGIAPERVDAGEIVGSVLQVMQPECAGKKVDISYRVPASALYIAADAQRIRQVLANLIINAVQAMPGGGTLSVEAVGADEGTAGAGCRIRISDTGAGIAPECMGKIFEPFYTMKKSGLGLGLAISRAIIEQHAGTLTADSVQGKGATFTIRIPLLPREEPAAAGKNGEKKASRIEKVEGGRQ